MFSITTLDPKVCDANLRIININSRFPGSSHDSFIWRASLLRDAFVNGKVPIRGNGWLLGDSGYPLEPWLLTPIGDAVVGSSEDRYNRKLSVGRNSIERCNGVLKSRFRCLLKHRVLHYMPDIAATIINACAVLHNICIANNLPSVENDSVSEEEYPETGDENPVSSFTINPSGSLLREAERLRQQLITTHF